MAFCSVSCQSKEASKSLNESYSVTYVHTDNTMHSSVGPGNYQMSYHRSPSFTNRSRKESFTFSNSYSNSNRHLMQSISSSTSFSSSISDISLISTPCSCEDKVGNICPPYHITRTT